MGNTSLLGAVKDRIKTTIYAPKALSDEIAAVSKALGVPRMVFYSMGALLLLTQLRPSLTAVQKRSQRLQELRKIMLTALDTAIKDL